MTLNNEVPRKNAYFLARSYKVQFTNTYFLSTTNNLQTLQFSSVVQYTRGNMRQRQRLMYKNNGKHADFALDGVITPAFFSILSSGFVSFCVKSVVSRNSFSEKAVKTLYCRRIYTSGSSPDQGKFVKTMERMLIWLGRGTYTSVFSIRSNGFVCFCVKALYC